jgi:hypothetical protein
MFLDAVLNGTEVVYNSIPINCYKWLKALPEEQRKGLVVYDGERLKRWTVEEYLGRQWEIPGLKK